MRKICSCLRTSTVTHSHLFNFRDAIFLPAGAAAGAYEVLCAPSVPRRPARKSRQRDDRRQWSSGGHPAREARWRPASHAQEGVRSLSRASGTKRHRGVGCKEGAAYPLQHHTHTVLVWTGDGTLSSTDRLTKTVKPVPNVGLARTGGKVE
jgi:hypothetical protein